MPYSVTPQTPEGDLLRSARRRKRARMEDVAADFGMSKEKLGYMERGYDSARKPYEYADADLARLAALLDIPAPELERIGRPDAAAMLRAMPPPPPPETPSPELLAAADDMFHAFADDLPERRVLFGLWYQVGPDARLLPLEHRMSEVARFRNRPRGVAVESAEGAG